MMKHTLKNRPVSCNERGEPIPTSYINIWFEGFEKELTAKLSDAEFSETKSIKNDTIIELIKELLGEDKPQ